MEFRINPISEKEMGFFIGQRQRLKIISPVNLITNLIIKDFRSISYADVKVSSGYLPLIGANNSGKSNFLRALNLFFNNETDPGHSLNLRDDFHNPTRREKRKLP